MTLFSEHPSQQRDIFSVSRLNREVRAVLEGSFPLLWISGEISNLARPASGHIYFSLKDEIAQVRCAMFRMKRQRLRFQPENGQQVLVRARVGLYEGRGDFQLLIEHMEPAGEGALQQAFEQLKQKLAAEGLFDSGQKRPLPPFPRTIGLITSSTGAALHDLLTVMQQRYPLLDVVIYPVQVQGALAAKQIKAMITLANRRDEVDLLILSRGGGSLEDLMPFNDEAVARAIADSTLPLISAVGHEVDFTIADFVADLRAATPSAAAELATPDQQTLAAQIKTLHQRCSHSLQQQLNRNKTALNSQIRHLQRLHPQQQLRQKNQHIDELELKLTANLHQQIGRFNSQIELLKSRLNSHSPAQTISWHKHQLSNLTIRLERGFRQQRMGDQKRLATLAHNLHIASPLNTLDRGYALVTTVEKNEILHDATNVSIGDRINVQLATGRLHCKVEKYEKRKKLLSKVKKMIEHNH
ncbi:MAG: exodeoxyribonuclease VII large subunit [Candidatus Polarisedimenticolaceae bacterium]|nr:exodeoxyribonuclease VII large subunit [Candidatus Polarisedimenticolaceae bacterium]